MRINFIQKIIDKLRNKKHKHDISSYNPYKIRIEGENNIVDFSNENNKKMSVINIFGNNNKIIIKTDEYFVVKINIGNTNCQISNCTIYVEKKASANGLLICMLEDNQKVHIGEDTMISDDVEFWVSDAHTILDKNKNIINKGRFIEIGQHCWIGRNVKILKNTTIPNNSICGYGAIVKGEFTETNCILAGIPANIVKKSVNWDRRSIKEYKTLMDVGGGGVIPILNPYISRVYTKLRLTA